MTRQKRKAITKLFAILCIMAFMFGYTGTALGATSDPNTSDTPTVSMGSSLFTGSKYMTISAHEKGLSVRVNELFGDNEYASSTFTNELYMDNYFVKYTVNDTNFTDMSLVFKYDYVQDPANWNYTPEQQKQVLHLKKNGENIDAWVDQKEKTDENAVKTPVTSKFVGDMTVSFEGKDVKVNGTKVGSVSNDAFPNKKAQLEIRVAGISSIETDSEKQTASFYLKEMGYNSNVKTASGATDNDKVVQSFVSDSKVKDTSIPVARMDKSIMPTFMNEDGVQVNQTNGNPLYYAPSGGTVTVPVSGMDIVKTSMTYTIEVKYSAGKDADWNAIEKVDTRTSNTFEPNEVGYYAVTKITVSDGKNKVTLTDKDNDSIDQVKLPIVYKTFFDQTDPIFINSDNTAPVVNPYSKNFENIETLSGGSKKSLQLPYPKMGTDTVKGQLIEKIGIDESNNPCYANNAKSLSYTVNYKSKDSSSYSISNKMTLTVSSVGEYVFYLQVKDLSGKLSETNYKVGGKDYQDFFMIRFKDKEELAITVSSFPQTKYVNQSVSLPSGAVVESMGSTSATIEVFFIEDTKGNKLWNCEWQYEMNSNGTFKKDSSGNKILKLKDGYPIPAVYEGEDADTTHPAGKPIYIDNDGERIAYTKQSDGTYECTDRVAQRVSTSSTFTPKFLGKYKAVYSAKDTYNNKAEDVVRYFDIENAPQSVTASGNTGSGFHISTLSIVFLSVAGACAIGIVLLIVIKPKEKAETTEAKSKKAKK